MHIIKNLLIAIVIGLIAYETTTLLLADVQVIPMTLPDIGLLLLFIATAFVATLVGTAQSAGAAGREAGTVKWFNTRKGYGFITRDQGEDIFVHFRNIEAKGQRGLDEGQRVTFVVTTSEKGPQADKVTPL